MLAVACILEYYKTSVDNSMYWTHFVLLTVSAGNEADGKSHHHSSFISSKDITAPCPLSGWPQQSKTSLRTKGKDGLVSVATGSNPIYSRLWPLWLCLPRGRGEQISRSQRCQQACRWQSGYL